MPSVSNFQTALEGILVSQITAAATTATVKVKEINGVTPTWLTTAHRITIIQKSRTVTKVEVVDVAAGTTQSGSTVTLGTMTRGLPLDGTGFTGTGTAQVFTSGAKVIVTWDAQAGRQTAFKDIANSFSANQTITSTNELRFADSATAIWDDGTDLNFKSSAQATRTLSQLASASGSNDKVKISSNDTTEDYLVNKVTGGDGITVTETDDAGDETLDIDLDIPVLVASGGTGRTSHTAYAVVCGGTTTTAAQQSIASVGTAKQVLTSNGAGALPTFQGVAQLLYSNLAASSAAGAGTTNESAFDVSYSIGAGTLAAGDVLRVRAVFTATKASVGATDDVTLRLKLGTTTIGQIIEADDTAASHSYVFETEIVVRSIGGSGSLYSSTRAARSASTAAASSSLLEQITVGANTFDTTGALSVNASAQFGNNSGSNTSALQSLTVTRFPA